MNSTCPWTTECRSERGLEQNGSMDVFVEVLEEQDVQAVLFHMFCNTSATIKTFEEFSNRMTVISAVVLVSRIGSNEDKTCDVQTY